MADLKPPYSEVENAKPGDAYKDRKNSEKPLTLAWSFGFNPSVPVHNISASTKKIIFYASGNNGIICDFLANKQCLLQGHRNSITSTAVSGDRRWLVTADLGIDPCVIVWDSYSGIPVKSLFTGVGCAAVAMSTDAKYIATLTTGLPQVVSIWDWTSESESPMCSVTLPQDYSEQSQLMFNYENNSQLVCNGVDQVVFYSWSGTTMNFNSTLASEKDFNRAVASLSQSCFIPGTTQALTGCTDGCCIVWEDTKLTLEGSPQIDPHVKRPIKLTKLHEHPITVVTVTKRLVVIGDSTGVIKFFDSRLTLINWYDSLKFGPLASISFSYNDKLSDALDEPHYYPSDCTMPAKPFVVPDFIAGTTTATISHITCNGTTIDVLLSEHDASICALAAHPSEPRLLVGSHTHKLKLWDYEQRVVLVARSFKELLCVQCVAFDPKGEFVGIGFTNGVVTVLDALSLEDICPPFSYSHDSITHVSFSHDSQYMATADLDLCVAVYKQGQPPYSWAFLAKYRSHYKEIEGLLFGIKLDSADPRLLSIGSDRTLVEYDLLASGVDDLKIMSRDRIEQSGVPTAMTWYPPLTKESFILVANDQYKLKLYNSTTKLCRRTLLGPTYGHPLQKLIVLPQPVLHSTDGQETRRYLAYITKEKVGLLLLPHDGNPHNSGCVLAHPGQIRDLACSHDGKYLFTAGGDDCTVNTWLISTQALEAAARLGGTGLTPFYALLEGGRDGQFFSEMVEFFYYAQIRSQGPDATCTREVSTDVDINQIPNIMRAIGFYPSEQEVDDMLNEVKFSKFVETGKCVTEINLEDFIKLYINYRPAFGLSPADLSHAFSVLSGDAGEHSGVLDRTKLLSVLQEKGEHITEKELVEYIMTLLGYSINPEIDGTFSEDPINALEELPSEISVSQFAEELLGLSTQ